MKRVKQPESFWVLLLKTSKNVNFHVNYRLIINPCWYQNACDDKIHGTAQLLLYTKPAKRDSISHCTIFNINMFDIALNCFHFKIMKNGDKTNLIVVIALNAECCNKNFLVGIFKNIWLWMGHLFRNQEKYYNL